MIDLNHGSDATPVSDIALAINERIDKALKTYNDLQPTRTYLGASALGAECERQIQLDYIEANDLGAPKPDWRGFSGPTLRIFAAGHAFEAMVAGWLRAAGFDLRTENEDGFQFGFSTANGRFKGHCDGVIIAAPVNMACPALWEHKALGQKSWQEVIKKGVAIARPQYAAQVAIYQAYLNLSESPALFTALNRDTAELYHELIPFDASLAQKASDRAVKILQATEAGELLPLYAAKGDHYVCKRCRWHGFCWGNA